MDHALPGGVEADRVHERLPLARRLGVHRSPDAGRDVDQVDLGAVGPLEHRPDHERVPVGVHVEHLRRTVVRRSGDQHRFADGRLGRVAEHHEPVVQPLPCLLRQGVSGFGRRPAVLGTVPGPAGFPAAALPAQRIAVHPQADVFGLREAVMHQCDLIRVHEAEP
ncbi:hypothetical protein ACFYXP_00595 [Streptomyces sp. NPDC002466]|uniref:hypothetical protein n=1 Tax=Streptomyces sp. NPDC002466 TaxID=3364646 RepID=UPI0036AEAFEC